MSTFCKRADIPDAKEGREDRSVDLCEVVVAVVDRLQLVQLGKRVPRDLHQLIERGLDLGLKFLFPDQ